MDKYEGSPWGGTLTFAHKGPDTSVVAALGLNIEGTGVWIQALIPCSFDPTPKVYSVPLSGIFTVLGKLSSGRTIGVLKALQWPGEPLNINGEGMIIADWDTDVYTYRGSLPGSFTLRLQYPTNLESWWVRWVTDTGTYSPPATSPTQDIALSNVPLTGRLFVSILFSGEEELPFEHDLGIKTMSNGQVYVVPLG